MLTTLGLLVGLIAALVLSAFFSGAETGVYSLNRVRLRVASQEGHRAAQRLEACLRRPENIVITALLGTNVADYLITACLAALLLRAGSRGGSVETYSTLIATPLILVFGGLIPKDWFRRESNRLMLGVTWPLLVCLRLAQASGIVWAGRALTHALVRWFASGDDVPADELLPRARTLRLLREGAAHGELSVIQRDLIERVLRLSEVRIGEVMVPRKRAALVPRDIAVSDFRRVARMAHFSRLPVYEGGPRNIVGIVNVYDVLTAPEATSIEAHIRPALYLQAHVNASTALLTMQRAHAAMTIVRDRTGACVGLLTLKDLVEEIVGDLEAW